MKRFKYYALGIAVVMVMQVFFASFALAGPYYPDLEPTDNYKKGSAIFPGKVINDFNSPEEVAEWVAGENTKEINYATNLANGPIYEGSGTLEQVPEDVKVYEWRTIYREYETPLDLTDYNYFALAANSWAWQSVNYFLKVKLYSGDDVFESIATISPNTWNPLFFHIKEWEGKNAITKIEISFLQNFDLEGIAPGAPGYDYWNGRFQIDYIVATNIIDMQFSTDGETEGFTANNGQVSVNDGALHYEVTGDESYLQSPELSHQLTVHNSLIVPIMNQTDAKEVKVSWTTEEDSSWDEKKSKVFALESSDEFIDHQFNFSDNPHWKGTLTQFRIEPLVTETTGTLSIDKVKLDISLELEGNLKGQITSSHLKNKETIEISGTVNEAYLEENPDSELLLYELATYEKKENLADFTPIKTQDAKAAFSFELPLKEEQHNRLYSKFVVAVKNAAGEISLVDDAHYLTNPEMLADNTKPFPEGISKKGLQVQMTDDAEELGISHAALNVAYDQLLYKENSNPENTIPYEFEGETFYFKKSEVEALDTSVKSLSDNNYVISFILILYNEMYDDAPNEHLIHPDAEEGGIVYAMNTANEIGVKYYKAITNFLAERYTREDEKYGKVVNYIVGNEVDENFTWNNMGPKLVTDYVKEYAQTLRLTNTIVKSNYANGRVYTSLTHDWDKDTPAESMGSYDGRDIVDMLTQHVDMQGNIPWNIAYHPYPENLTDPAFWKDPNAGDSFDTDVITLKNLEVLVDYMKQDKYLYDGEMRRIILSEQGFHSLDNSPEAQKLQAAAYAYAYYKVRFLDGIDSFILHRHVDHKLESDLHLGLWTYAEEGTNLPHQQKYIYDVFKYIDTEKSLEVSDFAKSIIGIDRWEDVIPGFDPKALAEREIPKIAGTEIIKKANNEKKIQDFEEGIGNWQSADNANSVTWNKSDSFAGQGSLQVNFNAIAKSWRGTEVKFGEAINASKTPYLNLALKIPNAPDNREYHAKVKVYNGAKAVEGVYAIENEEEWNRIALDLRKWEGIDSIDRIKIWVKSTTVSSWSGSFLVDEVSFSKNVVPVGGHESIELNTKMDTKDLQVGTKVEVEVTNNGSKDMQGEITIQPSEYVTFDQNALKVNGIQSGKSKTFTLAVTDVNLPEEGPVSVVFEYRERTWEKVLDVIKKTTVPEVLFDFEEDTEAWAAGENVSSIERVGSFANEPKTAYLGDHVLAVNSGEIAATDWKTVYIEPDQALDLSDATELIYYINSYGGVPNATYESKVTLYSGDESLTQTVSINPDNWNEVRLDLSEWAFKNEVTKIEISFRAVGNDMPWETQFQLDAIGYKK